MAKFTRRSDRAPGVAAVGALLALILQSCVSVRPPAPPTSQAAVCEDLFLRVDELVSAHGVGDAGAARVSRFPYLRVNRFLASFAHDALGYAASASWMERLRQLDAATRAIELGNLPPGAVSGLQAHLPDGLTVSGGVGYCGRLLVERDLKSSQRRALLRASADAPDAYATWLRVLGLYPLMRWGIVEGVARVHREMREPFIFPHRPQPAAGRLIHYAPAAQDPVEAGEIAALLKSAAANPLGIPEPDPAQRERLFAAFAPIWAVDTLSDDDRPGAARFDETGRAHIDVSAPVTYHLLSHARIGRQILLQLNYLIWFPARPPLGPLDIYAGRFDGLIWRVTLGADGRPLAYDSIHPCGCYYLIFPGDGLRVVQPRDGSESVLSPQPIPRLRAGERLLIRLAARTHFIEGIARERGARPATAYEAMDYDRLRSLPLPDGRRRSWFGPDGLVPGSARTERFLFWPMGVPSAGAMRQWGTHAIAFLGRRHFDEPRLLEQLLRPLGE